MQTGLLDHRWTLYKKNNFKTSFVVNFDFEENKNKNKNNAQLQTELYLLQLLL